jgi:hypothetical protein
MMIAWSLSKRNLFGVGTSYSSADAKIHFTRVARTNPNADIEIQITKQSLRRQMKLELELELEPDTDQGPEV